MNSTTPISWICKNQLGRRNLTPQQKKYLIGQRYDAEKKTHGGDRKSNLPESSGQNDHLIAAQKTRERIASETGTSESYVKRADQYAKGVDAAEEVLPGIKNDLLLGKFKPRETDVAAVARASPEERREKAEQLRVIPEKKPKNEKTTYRFGNRSFIVEPVFKEETQNTLGYPRLSGTSHYSGRALFPVYIRKPKQARETNCYKGSFTKPVQNSILQQNDAYDNLAFFASRMASVNTDLRSNERNQIEADLDQYYPVYRARSKSIIKPSRVRYVLP